MLTLFVECIKDDQGLKDILESWDQVVIAIILNILWYNTHCFLLEKC